MTIHAPVPSVSRRGLLIGAAAVSGAFVLGFQVPMAGRARAAGPGAPAAALAPFDTYLRIAPDNTVTVVSAHMEMGQDISHGIATLVGEELGVAPAAIRVEGGAGNVAAYGNIAWGGTAQGTGGSTGATSSWQRYRHAGAAARTMLIAAAAAAWNVPAATVRAEDGVLTAGARRATYGEMAAAAAALPLPADVPLKPPAQWTHIGRDGGARVHARGKVDGSFRYTIDVRLPGMLTAVVARPPLFGGRVRSFDAAAALRVKGVTDVVQVSRGVAVVATDTWAALRGRAALQVTWDDSAAETRGSADILAAHAAAAAGTGTVAAARGDAAAALAAPGGHLVEATYRFPYLAHAALEPLDAVVRRTGDAVEVWGGHQIPDLYQALAARAAGTAPDKVVLHVMPTGGGFGRRAVTDADVIVEAVETARAIGWRAPVKLLWTREDDMTGGRYRPAFVHRVRARVGADGRIAAWSQHVVGQSILVGTPFEAVMVKDGIDATSVEGASDTPYAIPALRVEVTNARAGVPVLWWRSVGHTHTAYAVECTVDALAAAAGQDPVAFRLAHLPADSRQARVLRLVAERAGWGTPPAAGRWRGVAVHQSFGTVVAMVAEVTAAPGGRYRVERVVAAVDCGTAINPDVVRAQVEGGIGFGLGAAMAEEITLAAGRVEQTNYDVYTPLRIADMPRVEVHILPSTAPPTGIGEPAVPPTGAAVANAIAAASGRRITTLPFARGLGA